MTDAGTVLVAVAERLHAAGAGVWRPDTAHLAGETAIVLKDVPQSPDRILSLNIYGIDAHPNPKLTDRLWRLQLRVRAGRYPIDVDQLAESAHGALEVHHQTWGELRVARCHRVSYLPLGTDGNGRREVTANYELLTS